MPKKNSITSANPAQMSFLDQMYQTDKRPLPELIASGGTDWAAFPLAYVDADGARYYSVQDWLRGVAHTEDANDFFNKLIKRYPELPTRCRKLPYKASNGKTYQMDHTNAGGLYAITQGMGANTGVAKRITDYLIEAGVRMDEYRLNPALAFDAGTKGMLEQGVSPSKIKARADGIIARNEMTTTAKITNKNHSPNYGALTSYEYQNLFGRGRGAIAAELGLTKSQTEHEFRDHIDELALKAIESAELTASRKMQQVGRLLTDEEQIEIVVHSARIAAKSFKEMADYVGRDLATGKPLLKSGK